MTTCLRVLVLLLMFAARSTFAAGTADQTLLQYGQQCADEVGEIPAFSCDAGTTVPITVNNHVPKRYVANMTCDRPALLPYESPTSGPCTPYSKIINLSHGETEISAFCRRKMIRADQSPLYDEVDIVLHNTANGKTCWCRGVQRLARAAAQ
jgi:hypothetical protein